MKISTHSFALAGALTTSIFYGAITTFFKLWPYETLQFISTAHMIPRLENIMPYIKITSAGILTGISIHFFAAYLFFAIMAFLYNVFASFSHRQ